MRARSGADPDLQIAGGEGGHPDPEIRGGELGLQKINGGRPPGPLPWIRHWRWWATPARTSVFRCLVISNFLNEETRFRINVCSRKIFTNGTFSFSLRQFSNRGIDGLTLKSGGVLYFCSLLKKKQQQQQQQQKAVQLTSGACGGLQAHPLQPPSVRVCSKLFPPSAFYLREIFEVGFFKRPNF